MAEDWEHVGMNNCKRRNRSAGGMSGYVILKVPIARVLSEVDLNLGTGAKPM